MKTDNAHSLYIAECELFTKRTGVAVLVPRLLFPGSALPYRLALYTVPKVEVYKDQAILLVPGEQFIV